MVKDDKRMLIDLTKKLISIKSCTGKENNLASFLEKKLSDMGLEVEREEIDGRYNLLAHRGRSRYLIATHLDTTPAWGFRWAFRPREKEGRIYGRGAVDTKGQISALILAIEKTTSPCSIALFVDEEKDGKGSEMFAPRAKYEGALVLEPTNFRICTEQAGSIELHIEVKGKESHGAIPEKGRSAIKDFIEIYERLQNLEHLRTRPKGFEFANLNLGWIRGGIDCQVTPRSCEGEIDIPIFPGDDIHYIKKRIEEIMREHDATFRVKVFDQPIRIPRDEPVVKILERSIEGIRKVEYSGMPAWTDAANLIEKGIPSVIFGAGKLEVAHTREEHIGIEDIYDLYLILRRFIELSAKQS